ncbi:MAG: FRG domain-containing protein [Rhodoglobus sp.]
MTPSDSGAQGNKTNQYSEEFHSPESYYRVFEDEVVDSWDALQNRLDILNKEQSGFSLVWRGVVKSSWGLFSSLYRELARINGALDQNYSIDRDESATWPTEEHMQNAEKKILHVARDRWRRDGSPALEILANLQHFGAPTRLIDVTMNPLIAVWFAVEEREENSGDDGRVFALARASLSSSSEQPHKAQLVMDSEGSSRDPFWHLQQQESTWGTGALRRLWVPPAYNERIAAQQAAFLLDGVPIISQERASSFRKDRNNPNRFWKKADLLASSSIYTKLYTSSEKVRLSKRNWAPTFTFRIAADAKQEIREALESRYGMNAASVYPDISGLASYTKNSLRSLLEN